MPEIVAAVSNANKSFFKFNRVIFIIFYCIDPDIKFALGIDAEDILACVGFQPWAVFFPNRSRLSGGMMEKYLLRNSFSALRTSSIVGLYTFI